LAGKEEKMRMENAKIKFSCKKDELKDALKKHCGLRNTEIKTDEDVAGAVKSLLGTKELIFVDVDDQGCKDDCCGDYGSIIITLRSISTTAYPLDKYGVHEDQDKKKFVLTKFLDDVKKLQKMIFGDND